LVLSIPAHDPDSSRRRAAYRLTPLTVMIDPTPSAMDEPLPKLPDLNDARLDWTEVEALLRDIASLTRILEIVPRFAARGFVGETPAISLDQARELLAQGAVRGVQIRYHYDQAEWWDTLMPVDGQFRLVRIRHALA